MLKVKATHSCPLPQGEYRNSFPLGLGMLSMVGGWFGGLELFSLLGTDRCLLLIWAPRGPLRKEASFRGGPFSLCTPKWL